jgi:hypothetical protein
MEDAELPTTSNSRLAFPALKLSTDSSNLGAGRPDELEKDTVAKGDDSW